MRLTALASLSLLQRPAHSSAHRRNQGVARRLFSGSTPAKVLLLVLAVLMGGAQVARANATCSTLASFSNTSGSFNVSLTAGETVTITNPNSNTQVYLFNPSGTNVAGASGNSQYAFPSATYVVASTGTYQVSPSAISRTGAAVGYTLSCGNVYTVTVATDDGGTASNCTPGSTTDASCSLRDALVAAIFSGVNNTINFSSGLAGSNGQVPFSITLGSAGTFTMPTNTTIQGLTTGSGATLTNLATVNGNGTTNIFFLDPGVTATINNLTITAGSGGSAYGGAIDNNGTLTLNQDTILNNTAVLSGGAIANFGSLTITNSTLSGNKTTNGFGGAIYDSGTLLTITNSTLTGNSSTNTGGAIYNYRGSATITNSTVTGNQAVNAGGIAVFGGTTLNLSNSIVMANTASSTYADIQGSSNNLSASLVNSGSSGTSAFTAAELSLAPFANYGGPTQTMPVMPGSPAFCYTSVPFVGTDQRGFSGSSYNGTACTDAGATQSSYVIAFSTQPAASYNSGAALSATTAPVVEFTDHGSRLPVSFGSVVFTDASSALTTTPFSVTPSGGYASLDAATFTATTPITGDTLTGTYTLALPNSGSATLSSGASSAFNIAPVLPTQIVLGSLPQTTAGSSPGSAMATLELANNATATSSTATVTFTLSGPTGFTTATFSGAAVGGVAMQSLPVLTVPGMYSLTATTTSPALTSNTVTFNVVQLTPVVTVSATSPVLAGTSLASLTASAVYGSTPVAGTFAFTATPSGGTASPVTSATVLGAGSYLITALFTPTDAVAYTSASSTITITVVDFTFSDSGPAGTTSLPINRGGTVTDVYTFTPVGAATFPAAITLTVTGVPANITTAFNPYVLAANFSSATSTLTATVSTSFVLNRHEEPFQRVRPNVYGEAPFALALLLLPFAGRLRKAGRRVMALSLVLVLSVVAMASITGCGSSSKGPEFVPLTVTATSGTLSHSVTVNILVQ